MNEFIKAINGTAEQPEILVYFRDSTEPAKYTAAIMELLKTDPATQTICNAETGEVIYTGNESRRAQQWRQWRYTDRRQ